MNIKEYHTYIAQNNMYYRVGKYNNGIFSNENGKPMWFPNGKYCHEQGKNDLDLLYEISYIDSFTREFCDIINYDIYKSLTSDQKEKLQNIVTELLDAN